MGGARGLGTAIFIERRRRVSFRRGSARVLVPAGDRYEVVMTAVGSAPLLLACVRFDDRAAGRAPGDRGKCRAGCTSGRRGQTDGESEVPVSRVG